MSVAVLAGAVVMGGGGPVAAATTAGCQPSITDLGDPFGGGFSYADGVNSSGTVVGSAFLPNGLARAVMWQGGQAIDLGVIGKYDESFAHGVSDDGTVVGELNYQQRTAAPFMYSHGQMRRLPGLGGGFGYALGINSHDVIVGTSSDPTGHRHAVIWTDQGRTVHDLGIAPDDVDSFASGINNVNWAAGDSDDTAGNERPALFANGRLTLLSTRQTTYGSAEDINDRAQTIGISFLPNGEQHATYWPPYQTRGRDLGLLPGGDFASLVDIDNAGHAVGGGNSARHPDTTHAIFWPGNGPLQLLRPLSGHLYRDFGVARELDTHGNAVGASQNDSGQIRGTVWRCAAAQTVNPTAPTTADTGASAATPVTLPAAVAR